MLRSCRGLSATPARGCLESTADARASADALRRRGRGAKKGEATLVAEIARELAAHGISVTPTAACPAPRATVARRGDELVAVADAAAPATERGVTEAGTAATGIESFTRTDVAGARVRLAASVEGAFANDDTRWLGASVKVRITVGPTCAGARFRSSVVGRGAWARRAWSARPGCSAPRRSSRCGCRSCGEASAMLGWLLVEAGDLREAARRFRAAAADPSPEVRTSAEAGLDATGAGGGR